MSGDGGHVHPSGVTAPTLNLMPRRAPDRRAAGSRASEPPALLSGAPSAGPVRWGTPDGLASPAAVAQAARAAVGHEGARRGSGAPSSGLPA